MLFTYTPIYRPPQFSGLPKGWELLELPHDTTGFKRPDLKRSIHRFGVIGYKDQLSHEQLVTFELMYLGVRS